MIDDLLLRWVVTGLFVLSAAQWGFAVITQRRVWTAIVRYGLHFVMSIGMAVMVWPWGAQLPTTGPAVFFLLAAVWFVVATTFVSERTVAKRAEYVYHALMMLAMAWMYAVMNGHLLPGQSATRHHMPRDMPMPDMNISATDMPPTGGSPGWVTTINWFWFAGLVVAAVFWAYRFAAERSHGAVHRWWLDSLGQAMMAAGMAIVFGAMLFQA
jgi:Domain of unknown function (DUF5134)